VKLTKKSHMIKPVNDHLLIEPVPRDSFMASVTERYQEIGTVIDNSALSHPPPGTRVYFDAWLAKKYPKEGSETEFYWLVKYEDVTAVENAEQEPVSELDLQE